MRKCLPILIVLFACASLMAAPIQYNQFTVYVPLSGNGVNGAPLTNIPLSAINPGSLATGNIVSNSVVNGVGTLVLVPSPTGGGSSFAPLLPVAWTNSGGTVLDNFDASGNATFAGTVTGNYVFASNTVSVPGNFGKGFYFTGTKNPGFFWNSATAIEVQSGVDATPITLTVTGNIQTPQTVILSNPAYFGAPYLYCDFNGFIQPGSTFPSTALPGLLPQLSTNNGTGLTNLNPNTAFTNFPPYTLLANSTASMQGPNAVGNVTISNLTVLINATIDGTGTFTTAIKDQSQESAPFLYTTSDGTLTTGTVGAGLSFTGGTLSAPGGSSGFSGNAAQFTSSGGTTNIIKGALVTNIVVYAMTNWSNYYQTNLSTGSFISLDTNGNVIFSGHMIVGGVVTNTNNVYFVNENSDTITWPGGSTISELTEANADTFLFNGTGGTYIQGGAVNITPAVTMASTLTVNGSFLTLSNASGNTATFNLDGSSATGGKNISFQTSPAGLTVVSPVAIQLTANTTVTVSDTTLTNTGNLGVGGWVYFNGVQTNISQAYMNGIYNNPLASITNYGPGSFVGNAIGVTNFLLQGMAQSGAGNGQVATYVIGTGWVPQTLPAAVGALTNVVAGSTTSLLVGYPNAGSTSASGADNTWIGAFAGMTGSSTGTDDTFDGYAAGGTFNGGASFNTAVGSYSSGAAPTTGSSYNTSVGYQSLYLAPLGQNVAIGAMANLGSGTSNNVSVGTSALRWNQGAWTANNVAVGWQAGYYATNSTNCIYLGANLFPVGTYGSETNVMRLGNPQIATTYIYGTSSLSGLALPNAVSAPFIYTDSGGNATKGSLGGGLSFVGGTLSSSGVGSGTNFFASGGTGNAYNLMQVIDLNSLGAIANGIFDNGTIFSNAMTTWSNAAGGIVQGDVGEYVSTRPFWNPYNLDTIHTAPQMWIRGMGPGSTTFDFDLAANTNWCGCIDGRAFGRCTVSDLEIGNSGAGTMPLCFFTEQTPTVQNCVFIQLNSATNIAVQLGGTNNTAAIGSTNSAFAGYIAFIQNNEFFEKGVGVWCGSDCNGAWISGNYFIDLGNGVSGGLQGAIVCEGYQATSLADYNQIIGNTFEMTYLQYGIWCNHAFQEHITDNAMDDNALNGTTIASIYCGPNNAGQHFITGNWNNGQPTLDDHSGGYNFSIDNSQNFGYYVAINAGLIGMSNVAVTVNLAAQAVSATNLTAVSASTLNGYGTNNSWLQSGGDGFYGTTLGTPYTNPTARRGYWRIPFSFSSGSGTGWGVQAYVTNYSGGAVGAAGTITNVVGITMGEAGLTALTQSGSNYLSGWMGSNSVLNVLATVGTINILNSTNNQATIDWQ
jgi:hypothetical protein